LSATLLRTKALAAAVIAATLGLAAACGGSSGGAGLSTKPPSVDTYPDQNGVNLALQASRDDAAAGDTPVVGYAAKVSNGAFKVVGDAIETAPYGIAVPKDDSGLRDAMAAALAKIMSDGTYDTILKKWGVEATTLNQAGINGAAGSPTPVPTGDPKSLVPAKYAGGTVKVASDVAYAPIEFFDKDHKTIIGVDPDIAAAIGQVLGVTFKFTNVTFNGIIPALAAGRYDIAMSAMTDNTDREKQVDFIDYLSVGSSIMVRSADDKGITGFNATLCGHSVAAERGTVQVTQVKAIKC